MGLKKHGSEPQKPIWFSELLIDQTMPLDDHEAWTVEDPERPCRALDELGAVAVELTRRMNILEPDYRNFLFIRVPICS